MRILVIEDDKKILSFVANGFKQAGYAVDQAKDGRTGLQMALEVDYDAAIVDIMLPQMDGLAVVEQLRRHQKKIPVIFLSAKREVDDRVRGLEKGGDDYLTKPFSFSELLARVQALLRRSSQSPEPTRLSINDISLNLLTREVRRDGRRIELQTKEFALLEYMLRCAGQPVSKTMILEHIWDYHFDPQTNVVDVLVSRLRGKIDRDFKKKLIQTIRGVGYVLKGN